MASNKKARTKIHLNSLELKWFIVDGEGNIVTANKRKEDWDNVVIDMDSVEVGKPLKLSFNSKAYRKLSKGAKIKKNGVWVHTKESMDFLEKINYTKLAHNTVKVESLEN